MSGSYSGTAADGDRSLRNRSEHDKRTAPASLWALLSVKAGDNAQVRTLCEAAASGDTALVAEKTLGHHALELLQHLRAQPTLAGVRAADRAALAPPWPRLVIGAGRRNELPARWIKARSGGKTRLVWLGRPWAGPEQFDLIVTTTQYAVPERPWVLRNLLPLQTAARERSSTARNRWASTFSSLPGPRIAVLLGGHSGHRLLTAAQADTLGVLTNQLAVALAGSVLVTTSRRTPGQFLPRFLKHMKQPVFHHQFGTGKDNPYAGMLAWADAAVVTAESASMIADALAARLPTYLFPVDPPTDWWLRADHYQWRAVSHRLVQRFAPERFRRDLDTTLTALISGGHARWLADHGGKLFDPEPYDFAADLAHASARTRALLSAPD